jgi:F-type H+-transporting ATPase subunit epsilon
MHLDIITPDLRVFTGEAVSVQLPGSEGSFEVLNNHAPMIAALGHGRIKVTAQAGSTPTLYSVKGGIVEVLNNNVTVLAEQILK